ncbi:MAG: CpaD family pilus assembly lipoprotein [Pseudomonadota bacterium]
MNRHVLSRVVLAAAAGLALGACQQNDLALPENVQLEGLPFDNNRIGVERTTEVIEIEVNPAYSDLRIADRRALERFVAAFRDRGHGALVMAMPENGSYPDAAVETLKNVRTLAWENGVAWEQISGSAYEANGLNAPIVLAFDAYEAVAPECLSLAAYDMSDVSSNNEPAYYGCAVRNNIAMMIADPGDLLSRREIDTPDNSRVSVIMEAYRAGTWGGGEAVGVGN